MNEQVYTPLSFLQFFHSDFPGYIHILVLLLRTCVGVGIFCVGKFWVDISFAKPISFFTNNNLLFTFR